MSDRRRVSDRHRSPSDDNTSNKEGTATCAMASAAENADGVEQIVKMAVKTVHEELFSSLKEEIILPLREQHHGIQQVVRAQEEVSARLQRSEQRIDDLCTLQQQSSQLLASATTRDDQQLSFKLLQQSLGEMLTRQYTDVRNTLANISSGVDTAGQMMGTVTTNQSVAAQNHDDSSAKFAEMSRRIQVLSTSQQVATARLNEVVATVKCMYMLCKGSELDKSPGLMRTEHGERPPPMMSSGLATPLSTTPLSSSFPPGSSSSVRGAQNAEVSKSLRSSLPAIVVDDRQAAPTDHTKDMSPMKDTFAKSALQMSQAITSHSSTAVQRSLVSPTQVPPVSHPIAQGTPPLVAGFADSTTPSNANGVDSSPTEKAASMSLATQTSMQSPTSATASAAAAMITKQTDHRSAFVPIIGGLPVVQVTMAANQPFASSVPPVSQQHSQVRTTSSVTTVLSVDAQYCQDNPSVSEEKMEDGDEAHAEGEEEGQDYPPLPGLLHLNRGSTAAQSRNLSIRARHRGSGPRTGKKRATFPSEVVQVFKNWLSVNYHNPYPTEEEKKDMVRRTNITMQQLEYWFVNARRRHVQVLRQKDIQSGRTIEVVECIGNRRRSRRIGPAAVATHASSQPEYRYGHAHQSPPPDVYTVTGIGRSGPPPVPNHSASVYQVCLPKPPALSDTSALDDVKEDVSVKSIGSL